METKTEKTAKEYISDLKSWETLTIQQRISPTAKATAAIIGRIDSFDGTKEYFVAKNYFAFVSFLTCCTNVKRYNKAGKNTGTIYEIFSFKSKAGAIKKLDTILTEYKK